MSIKNFNTENQLRVLPVIFFALSVSMIALCIVAVLRPVPSIEKSGQLIQILAALGAVVVVGTHFLRRMAVARLIERVPVRERSSESVLRQIRLISIVTLVIRESGVIYGFVAVMLGGDQNIVIVLTIAALLLNFLEYPTRNNINALLPFDQQLK
jgi:hypothetical protein